ncbi:radical SAM protein, partial [Rhizobium leguminosarum]
EEMVRIVRELRVTHNFRGYIHLKSIPEASPRLIEEAGLHADRLSLNIELPTDNGITRFAPEKKPANIRRSMGDLRLKIEAAG